MNLNHPRAVIGFLCAGCLGMTACLLTSSAPARATTQAGASAFLGAGAGSPVEWIEVALPQVVQGPANDPPVLLKNAFTPTFASLVTGQNVIVNENQMKQIWPRLFQGTPYDPTLFDFDSSFVILVGGGLMHPFIGFAITDVESFDANFESVNDFDGIATTPCLAVRAVTMIPGPPPPKKDHVWKLAAVQVPWKHHSPIVLSRQALFAP